MNGYIELIKKLNVFKETYINSHIESQNSEQAENPKLGTTSELCLLDYNMILTEKWMLLVIRKPSEDPDRFCVNGCFFLGWIVTQNDHLFQERAAIQVQDYLEQICIKE